MKNSHVLAATTSIALVLANGCGPPKRAEFKELAPQTAEELKKAAEESPLNVSVTIDRESRLFVKNEGAGTTADLTPFKEKLAQALEKRRAYLAGAGKGSHGAEGGGAADVVYVRTPLPATSGEVVKVVDAIKGAGVRNVGVMLDTTP